MQKLLVVLMYSLKSEVIKLNGSNLESWLYFISAILFALFIIFVDIVFLELESLASILTFIVPSVIVVGLLFYKSHKVNERLYNTHLNCPNCGKHIPPLDPWMCPTCNEVDDVPAYVKEFEASGRSKIFRAKAYRFIYKCPNCTSVATTYKCHSCGEVLALTDNPDPERFAYNPLLLPDGVWVDEDLKSKASETKRKSKHPEVNEVLRQFDVKDEFFDVGVDRVEHYKRKVDTGQMTEEEAQEHLRVERLLLKRRRPLG